MLAWDAQSVQVVWFVYQALAQSVDNLYQAIIGAPPASFQVSPQSGRSVANGIDGQTGYLLQTQPGRIELIVTSADIQLSQGRLALLPDLTTTLSMVEKKFAQGSRLIGAVGRIALIVNTVQQATSITQANDFVLQKIGLALPFSGGTDLMFQINRRKTVASVPTCEFNRLMKWSAQIYHQITISGVGGTAPQELYAAILSVDVNTAPPPTAGILSLSEQVSIFTEMSAEADRLTQANSAAALA